ncbi:gene transfer agent family protein [Neorhizobium lilium]|uniref:Gene transfer agent family protein n=1 Tax=Neorhizobium lilium TaxID=2503024 RepID=A0A3S3VGP1_9HYPH|nr:gene transfer agent family protein [Neorhizobium lilium]RWX76156.1 gene transfer agent family protein [Neorhizobium lilium]
MASGRRANRRRGEVEALIDGQCRILCLTLGALAELETAFAAGDLAGLAARFSSGGLKAADMIRIIGAGLRGAGNLISDDDVAAACFDEGVAGCARTVGELLSATFAPADGAPTANP